GVLPAPRIPDPSSPPILGERNRRDCRSGGYVPCGYRGGLPDPAIRARILPALPDRSGRAEGQGALIAGLCVDAVMAHRSAAPHRIVGPPVLQQQRGRRLSARPEYCDPDKCPRAGSGTGFPLEESRIAARDLTGSPLSRG